MCDSQIQKLFVNLSTTDVNKRHIAIRSLIEKFQNAENLRSDIVNFLLKNLASIDREYHKGHLECFRWILECMNEEMLSATIIQMKENLFVKIKDFTKKEDASIKLGSILAFDAILTSIDISKIDKSSLLRFYNFVLRQMHDPSLGFLATLTIINLFKKISLVDFQILLKELKDDIFNIDILEKYPQHFLLWLIFSPGQKKALKKESKLIPAINSKEVLIKLQNLFKLCKEDQLITIINYLSVTSDFRVVWKYFLGLLIHKDCGVKIKQIMLLMAFESVCPLSNGLIIKQTKEHRLTLINKIWSDKIIFKLLLKQLAHPEYDLHSICHDFILKLNKFDDGKTSQFFLEQFFKLTLELGQDLIDKEYKINQTLRLTNCLLRTVENEDLHVLYVKNLENYFNTAEKYHQKIYVFEQLSGAAFIKSRFKNNKIPEFLLNLNYSYNYESTDTENTVNEIESARSAFLRCLVEMIVNNKLDQLKKLLESNSKIVKNEELINRYKNVLEFYNCQKEISKKRNKNNIDLTNKTNIMFLSLLINLCLYMTTQSCDDETIDIFDDVFTCFNEFRNCLKDNDNQTIKRSKTDFDSVENNENINENDWRIVLTDVLIVLLEQNCFYLRTLSSHTFKIMVTENLCTAAVIEHINMAIENSEMQSKNIDKKCTDNIDDEVSDNASDNDEEIDDNDASAIKARIFNALGSMVADVDSDSDDNCPEVTESDSSENEDKNQLPMMKNKVSIKEKRYSLVQLKNFRNRCIDLLEVVFLNAPRLSDRMMAFSCLIKRVQKSNLSGNIENRLLKAIIQFKKYQPSIELTVEETVSYINQLIKTVDKCNISKITVEIFSEMIVMFLRLNKSNLSIIANFFKPIIEKCIVEKKMHSVKAIFLKTFDIFPEVCWTFHSELLKFIGNSFSDQVQFQAACIIKKIITNRTIKDIVQNDRGLSYACKNDILSFVNELGPVLQVSIMKLNLQSHSKSAALFIGLLVDCLKLGGYHFYQKLDQNIFEKIKIKSLQSIAIDLKKTINQFVAAVDYVKKSVKNV